MNAYAGEAERLARIVLANQVVEDGASPFSGDLATLLTRQRFCILNSWTNADPNGPIQRAPLALLASAFPEAAGERARFPEHTPDPTRSRWYSFPNMDDEVPLTERNLRPLRNRSPATGAPNLYRPTSACSSLARRCSALRSTTENSAGPPRFGTAPCPRWWRRPMDAEGPTEAERLPTRLPGSPSRCARSLCWTRRCRRRSTDGGRSSIIARRSRMASPASFVMSRRASDRSDLKFENEILCYTQLFPMQVPSD